MKLFITYFVILCLALGNVVLGKNQEQYYSGDNTKMSMKAKGCIT